MQAEPVIWVEETEYTPQCYSFTGYRYCIKRYAVRTKDDAVFVDVKIETVYERNRAVEVVRIVNIQRLW